MEVEITSDVENELLNRREVRCLFRGLYGHLSRADAIAAASKKLQVSKKGVYVLSIDGGFGTRDAKGLFYVYHNEEDAVKDLPKYILKRNAVTEAATKEAKAQPEKPKEKMVNAEPPKEEKPEQGETKTPEKPDEKLEESSKGSSEEPKE